ncbi:MAG TPA: YcaO-related McrA-glycine thioamidation protein [Methanothermococcus okinawensis]|uniref:Ribosomal protein S12 methylthiotransferase accessory factor n=1 Tax=Methanofervidicoccus abyssi TaxID=2082189 RepID=A0A401HQX7_9EURY|nr:YcaO-related McrA-glycine thioamidation protein [Methanofervidicoccus abyssi]GBF36658.1 ribosomal protein S12 methylthiotransferase accessory factor [Methanofervidicoccus abyssi]HIP15667.1 YcaO-related McrA-glycine thioamidation protein [Methanothermococcus okinawensis]
MDIIHMLETYRICHPTETWNRITPILNKIGVKNIERIDHLDRIGIPVYAVERITQDGVIYHLGKGPTDIQAKVSGSMEAIERYSAELKPDDRDRLKDKPDNPVDIRELILPVDVYRYLGGKNYIKGIKWIEGFDIINQCSLDVPAEGVFHPYRGKLFRSHTNGIASGNNLYEAILHGALEVIERDAWSIAELSGNTYKKIDVEGAKNPLIHELLEKFESANINVILKDLTGDVGIPTVGAVCDEEVWRDPALLCIGVGCHLHPEIAVIRALTEVAQSRSTQLHNKRRDTIRGNIVRKVGYERMKRIHKRWYQYRETVNIEDMENCATYNLKKDLEILKEKLIEAGFDKLIYVDLKKTEIDTVRVIIPRMEVYSIDRDRISPWVKERIKRIKPIK